VTSAARSPRADGHEDKPESSRRCADCRSVPLGTATASSCPTSSTGVRESAGAKPLGNAAGRDVALAE
jgi:hypothetical protein